MRERAKTLGVTSASLWLEQNTEYDDDLGETNWHDLYDDCCRWHDEHDLPHPSRQAVGQLLSRHYVKRSTSVRVIYWQAVKLKRPSGSDRTDQPDVPFATAPAGEAVVSEARPCRD